MKYQKKKSFSFWKSVSVVYSDPATRASFLFSEHSRHVPTSEPGMLYFSVCHPHTITHTPTWCLHG